MCIKEVRMAYVVKNRLLELIAIKARNEGRSISRREIAEATGISLSSIQNWAHNNVNRFDGDQIAAFCWYFECGVDDLLIIKDAPETETPVAPAA